MFGFLSISMRILANVESLNSVESVGNLVRHRTAPIVIEEDGGYTIRFVPVVSGESIAHSYQTLLVEEAKKRGLPITEHSKRGEFIKFADDKFLQDYGIPIPKREDDIRKTEVEIMLKDYICDVGGFLYAGNYPVKRTSTFQVGYMLPAVREIRATALEAQFHVRHAPSSMKQYQQPYNVEVGSAVYTFTFNIDLDRISVPSTGFGERSDREEELANNREERVVAAVSALSKFLSSIPFGAKRSRFLPNLEYLSAVASYSEGVNFVSSPGNSKEFISETYNRSKAIEDLMNNSRLKKGEERVKIEIIAMNREDAPVPEEIEVLRNQEEFSKKIVELIFKRG